MADFVTAIQTAITVDTLWKQVTELAPFVGLVAIFVFGYYVTRKVIKGAGRGKINF